MRKQKEDDMLVKELADLYWQLTWGAMQIKIPWWKRFFKRQESPPVEEFITDLQSKVLTLVNTYSKKRLTFFKGLPYTMVDRSVFLKQLEDLQNE